MAMSTVFLRGLYYWLRLRRSQWRSADEMEADQWRRFRAILRHAYENVPFYRERLDAAGVTPGDIQTRADLPLIPVSTKAELRAAFPGGVLARGYRQQHCYSAVTSGSTGEPFRVLFDADALAYKLAVNLRSIEMAGYRPGDRLFQAGDPIKAGGRFAGRAIDTLMRRTVVSSTEKDLDALWSRLQGCNPDVIVGFASMIKTLADAAGGRGEALGVKAAITTAETLTPAARRSIESAFNTAVYDQYGGEEFGRVAQQCEARGGYHINTESVLVEIIRDGQPAAEGESGEIIITSLVNRAMPLIRYRMGDLGRFGGGGCGCGRQMPMLSAIGGRLNDVIVTPAGSRILPEYLYHMMNLIDGVAGFQVVQEAASSLAVSIMADEGFDALKADAVLDEMRQHIADCEIRLEMVDSIEPVAGKQRHIISLGGGGEGV